MNLGVFGPTSQTALPPPAAAPNRRHIATPDTVASLSPASFGNLRGWWDFSDTATVSTLNGFITQINDKSGNGFNLSQSVEANRPGVASINGLQAGSFDGTNDGLLVVNASLPDIQGTLICAATSLISAGTNNTLASVARTSADRFQLAYTAGVGLNVSLRRIFNSVTENLLPFTSIAPASLVMAGSANQSPNAGLRINGVQYTTLGNTAGMLVGNTGGISIGCHINNGAPRFPWLGNIGEVLWYSSVLPAPTLWVLERYLSMKWGIAVT